MIIRRNTFSLPLFVGINEQEPMDETTKIGRHVFMWCRRPRQSNY